MSSFTPEVVRTTPMTDFISPSTRRRRGGITTITNTPPVFTDSISRNDDCAERRQRLISSTTSAILSSPATPHSRTASRVNSDRERQQSLASTSSEGFSNFQIKDLYTNCIQLSAANKITSKNAFGLHLIDYMQDLIRSVQEGDMTNFQVAGCTLDASAKIYAGRVDSLHSQTYKMLSGFGRAENDEDATEEGNPDELNDHGPKGSQRKKKEHKNKQGSKISKNMDTLNVKQFDLEFEVDPLFHKTSAAFDEGGVRGLLLNNFSVRDDSCELLLDSTAVVNAGSQQHLSTQTPTQIQGNISLVDLSDYKDFMSKMIYDSVKICPYFADFEFTNWNRSERGTSNFLDKNTAVDHINSNFAFDVNAPPASDNVFEHSGVMEANDSFDDVNGIEDQDVEFGREGCAAERQAVNLLIGNETLSFADGQEAKLINPSQARLLHSIPPSAEAALGSLCLELSDQPSEYSYFKPEFLANWTGPEAWKMGLKKGSKIKSIGGPKKTKTRNGFKDPWENIDIDFEKKFCRTKAATVLAESTLKKLSKDKTILPEELQYAQEDLVRLLVKPNILVKRQDIDSAMAIDDGDLIKFNSGCDGNDYCPNLEVDDDDAGVCGDGTFEQTNGDRDSQNMTSDMTQSSQGLSFSSEVTLVDQTLFAGDGLVAQPNKVQKIDIGYAKTAKKMDAKRLKSTMWSILTETEEEENKENLPADGMGEQRKEIHDKEQITRPYPFDELYSRLKIRLPKHMAKNLTPHIAFVFLLHLANEKCLHLSGSDTMENLMITQGIQ